MSATPPKLIVGLGNPGAEYAGTRHNTGFIMLDRLAETFGAAWQEKPRFKAMVAQTQLDDRKVIFAKPTTFYNNSGEAVAALLHFYKLDIADLLVIHDELALPLGKIRSRLGGQDAGNNGIKSITAHLGPGFARIRIGIANESTPRFNPPDFVLSRFSSAEQQFLPAIAKQVTQLASDFLRRRQTFTHTSITVKSS